MQILTNYLFTSSCCSSLRYYYKMDYKIFILIPLENYLMTRFLLFYSIF